MKRFSAVFLPTLLLFASMPAYSAPVIMTSTSNNHMEVTFSLVSQHPSHNAIQFFGSPVSFGSGATAEARISLYDESGLLGSRIIDTVFLGGRFTSPSSVFSGDSISTDIDFSRLADGVSDGRFVFELLSGTVNFSFDTANVFGITFGDSGGIPAFYPDIHSVTVRTAAPVPEPEAYAMLVAGLVGLFVARRRNNSVKA